MKDISLMLASSVCVLSLLAGCADTTPARNDSTAPSEVLATGGNIDSDPAVAAAAGDKVGTFTPTILENGEASHITVQHVLIGFKGSVRGKQISRSMVQAEELAKEILAKAKAGEDFGALVKKHTDDSPPGIYNMANFGQDADMHNPVDELKVYPRDGMVGAFGNVGFPLKVGEVGLANYSLKDSKYGWHIIKRLK